MRPPGQSLPMVPFEKLYALDSPASQPFPLFVRQFGPDESATRRLLSRIQAWKNAGSPTANNMSIRAYLKDSLYKPSGGEIVLKKQWTKLVIEWPESNFHGGI
jgi:hypothetical protein